MCLLVKADLLLLAGVQGVSLTFHGQTRGHLRQILLEKNQKDFTTFTQGVNQRLTEEKLYGLVYNSMQKM